MHLSRVLGITSEDDVLTAGSAPTDFVTDDGTRVGMLCCFDLRFRALLAQYASGGPNGPCDVLCAPSAFLEVRAAARRHGPLARSQRLRLCPGSH